MAGPVTPPRSVRQGTGNPARAECDAVTKGDEQSFAAVGAKVGRADETSRPPPRGMPIS